MTTQYVCKTWTGVHSDNQELFPHGSFYAGPMKLEEATCSLSSAHWSSSQHVCHMLPDTTEVLFSLQMKGRRKGVRNPECSCKTWLWLGRNVEHYGGLARQGFVQLKQKYTQPYIALLNWSFFTSLPYNNGGNTFCLVTFTHTQTSLEKKPDISLGILSNSLLEIESQQEKTLGHQTPVPLSESSSLEPKWSL